MLARRTRLRFTLLAAVAVAGTIIGIGSIRDAAGDAQGGPITVAATAPAGAPTRLRLATFNIHTGVGLDGKLDLARTASVLKGFDLICLNEVRGGAQGQALGKLLGRQALFAPTERRFWRESYGNAALFGCRIRQWERTQLKSGAGMAFRNVLHLQVPFGSGMLHVLATHVGRGADRQPQLQAVSEMFLQLPAPALLMGDLNSLQGDPTMGKLLDSPGVEDPVGLRAELPRDRRFNYILLRGLPWTDAGLVENDASDHPMAWVEIAAP